MIYRFKDRFTVEGLCRLLDVSRSGYYKWLKRKDRPDKDKTVADLIAECHEKAHRTYGYRRVKIWLLRETGLVINNKAVLRIMRKYNLLAIRKRKRFRHYDCNTYTHYANELMRDFTATRPNEKWVTDISYIQTKQGFLYLSMIKDLYDNSIVGYKYATQMPASLVIETVRAAVKSAKPSGGLILHSDNGFQYTSQDKKQKPDVYAEVLCEGEEYTVYYLAIGDEAVVDRQDELPEEHWSVTPESVIDAGTGLDLALNQS